MPLRIVWTNGSQYDLTYQSLSSLINCKSGRGHLVVLLTILGFGHYVFRCVFVFCCVIYLQQFCMPFPFGIWTFLQSYFCFVLDLQCLVKADHWEILKSILTGSVGAAESIVFNGAAFVIFNFFCLRQEQMLLIKCLMSHSILDQKNLTISFTLSASRCPMLRWSSL